MLVYHFEDSKLDITDVVEINEATAHYDEKSPIGSYRIETENLPWTEEHLDPA